MNGVGMASKRVGKVIKLRFKKVGRVIPLRLVREKD